MDGFIEQQPAGLAAQPSQLQPFRTQSRIRLTACNAGLVASGMAAIAMSPGVDIIVVAFGVAFVSAGRHMLCTCGFNAGAGQRCSLNGIKEILS